MQEVSFRVYKMPSQKHDPWLKFRIFSSAPTTKQSLFPCLADLSFDVIPVRRRWRKSDLNEKSLLGWKVKKGNFLCVHFLAFHRAANTDHPRTDKALPTSENKTYRHKLLQKCHFSVEVFCANSIKSFKSHLFWVFPNDPCNLLGLFPQQS